ncbi:hypothetical protein [Neoasaia chiangmaiensis]|nr:hypothetical protein [Neoasaia chiangmaiensis]
MQIRLNSPHHGWAGRLSHWFSDHGLLLGLLVGLTWLALLIVASPHMWW